MCFQMCPQIAFRMHLVTSVAFVWLFSTMCFKCPLKIVKWGNNDRSTRNSVQALFKTLASPLASQSTSVLIIFSEEEDDLLFKVLSDRSAAFLSIFAFHRKTLQCCVVPENIALVAHICHHDDGNVEFDYEWWRSFSFTILRKIRIWHLHRAADNKLAKCQKMKYWTFPNTWRLLQNLPISDQSTVT